MKKILPLIAITMALLLSGCSTGEHELKLPSIIGSNMVLQQNQQVKLWGIGQPGSEITVEATWGEESKTKVNTDGSWIATIQTPEAGGPFQIQIANADTSVLLSNVLIGEVWVCSGQSNMEMPLAGWPPSDPIMNSEDEIASANHPDIRLFTVSRAIATSIKDDIEGQWNECSSETARDFSAAAYFFGRKLNQELGVPIGLIHSSWGGTPAESWVPGKHLRQIDDFTPTLNNIKESEPVIRKLESWLNQLETIDIDPESPNGWAGLDFYDSTLSQAGYNHSSWPTMELPKVWESTEVGEFDGVIWFRRNVEIPASWEGKELEISLGPIDDMDITYFNGQQIGATEQEGYWQMPRKYTIPSKLVKAGETSIAVRVLDNQGGGGIFGSADQMKIYPKGTPDQAIPLSGEWSYLPVAEFIGHSFHIFSLETKQYFERPQLPFSLSAYTPTVLYNAMIAPLVNYGIRGAIWYQGESNVGRAKQYQTLFPLLIESWREVWDQGEFPFYYVQIAPYNYGEGSAAAHLREAQLKTLSIPNTGMAVTLDIGNPENIHPANKVDVSERLALWALAKDYGHDLVYSGPIYKSMEVDGSRIILTFNYTDGGLKTQAKGLTNFTIAGNDQNFVPAKAIIKGNKVIVESATIEDPAAVRYLWDNTSEAALFNGHGLPASSFRTDNWN